MTIDNMFQEHTTRRYLQGSKQKIKTVAFTYLAIRLLFRRLQSFKIY